MCVKPLLVNEKFNSLFTCLRLAFVHWILWNRAQKKRKKPIYHSTEWEKQRGKDSSRNTRDRKIDRETESKILRQKEIKKAKVTILGRQHIKLSTLKRTLAKAIPTLTLALLSISKPSITPYKVHFVLSFTTISTNLSNSFHN